MSVVRLIMSLEPGFSIEITHREAARLLRISDLAELILRKHATSGD